MYLTKLAIDLNHVYHAQYEWMRHIGTGDTACKRSWVCVPLCLCMYLCVWVHECVCMCVCPYVCVCIYVWVSACIPTCLCIYVHEFIYMSYVFVCAFTLLSLVGLPNHFGQLVAASSSLSWRITRINWMSGCITRIWLDEVALRVCNWMGLDCTYLIGWGFIARI